MAGFGEVIRVGLHDGNRVLIRRGRGQSFLFLHHVRVQQEGGHPTPGRGPSPGTRSAGILMLDFPDSRTVTNVCCLSHSIYSILLEHLELTGTLHFYVLEFINVDVAHLFRGQQLPIYHRK